MGREWGSGFFKESRTGKGCLTSQNVMLHQGRIISTASHLFTTWLLTVLLFQFLSVFFPVSLSQCFFSLFCLRPCCAVSCLTCSANCPKGLLINHSPVLFFSMLTVACRPDLYQWDSRGKAAFLLSGYTYCTFAKLKTTEEKGFSRQRNFKIIISCIWWTLNESFKKYSIWRRPPGETLQEWGNLNSLVRCVGKTSTQTKKHTHTPFLSILYLPTSSLLWCLCKNSGYHPGSILHRHSFVIILAAVNTGRTTASTHT